MRILTTVRLLAFLLILSPVAGHGARCFISATPVNFGIYNIFAAAPLDSTGTISVRCTNPDKRPLPVTLLLSTGGSGSFGQRRMASGGSPDLLYYNLFTDAAKSTVFGDGTGGSAVLTNILSKSLNWNVAVYGRVPPRQNVRPSVYGDTLTATILW